MAGALGVLALPSVRSHLDLLAPGSGSVWGDLGPPPAGTVTSPYGSATVTYDDEGVPHIEADDELALQYAHGYAQGYDRLFQVDLFRRQLRGQLSEVAGEVTLDSDEFHRRMDFAGAAAASREAIADTAVEPVLSAFAEGMNAAMDAHTPPVETALLGYSIDPWTVTDTLLMEKLMGWELTGRFRVLRRAALAGEFGQPLADDLYPSRYDHDVAVLESGESPTVASTATRTSSVTPAGAAWLSGFEPPVGQGSNSWIVGGEHTASGGPILANDPHLSLMSPPIWYEVALETPEFATRGVTLPGVPLVIIGRNRSAAWGFTNVPADVMDFYRYDVDGDEYRLEDGWHAFETDETTIEVADGSDRTITRRFTSHGPYIERHGTSVGVSWTGLAGTRTVTAVRQLQFVDDHDSLLAAMETWDLPPQNLVYADRDGHARYHVVGKVPVRRTDGEAVRGDTIFDATAGEGEWVGFTPYEPATWEDVIPFDELPHTVDPAMVANANQRIVDEPTQYFAEVHATPFRAMRLTDQLQTLVDDGSIDLESMQALQQDVFDELAAMLVPELLTAAASTESVPDAAIDALSDWTFQMRHTDWAPLVFRFWLDAFRERVFGDPLADAGFENGYVPADWVLATLDADHPWFDRVGPREEHMIAALEGAADRAEAYDDYGQWHRTAIDHPFEVGFLGYPRRPIDGSPHTLKNFRIESMVGTGWQQVVDLGTDVAIGRLAGGNVGRVLSPHYHDQLDAWAEGRYKPLDWSPSPTRELVFEAGESQ